MYRTSLIGGPNLSSSVVPFSLRSSGSTCMVIGSSRDMTCKRVGRTRWCQIVNNSVVLLVATDL